MDPYPADPAPEAVTRVGLVIDALRARIDSRALGRGAKLPSVRRLAEELGVSKSTVVEAYDRLLAEGAVEARRGSGFFVAAAPQPLVLARAPSLDPAVNLLAIMRRELEAHPDVIQPGYGWLPESWLPGAAVEKALRAVARSHSPAVLRYDSPLGFEPLRRVIGARLAERGARVDPAQIVITDSTTQAIDLAGRFFLSPGDRVVVDDPLYFNFVKTIEAHRATIVGAPYTREGPDVVALEAIFAEQRPRIYLMVAGPHNPTGATISGAVAHRVLMLAERYDVVIVEDDVYGDFETAPSPRLATFDGFDRVVSVGGYSKTVSGGVRVGYLVARPDWVEPIVDLKLATTLTNSAFAAAAIHNLLTEGGYRRHLDALRARLADAIARTCLRLKACGVTPWIEPQSGMFVWAELPDGLDATNVARAAQADRVVFAPGRSFSASPKWRGFMRFNVGISADSRVFEALERAMARASRGILHADEAANAPA
jgi:DNA-binding transcriptional MocR family regulator